MKTEWKSGVKGGWKDVYRDEEKSNPPSFKGGDICEKSKEERVKKVFGEKDFIS